MISALRLVVGYFFLACVSYSEDRPNIVLILIDDLGRESVGSYGGESYKTPNLDKLSAEGMRFERFYASPMCHPTRVAAMSGRYLHTIGNPKWGDYPSGEIESQSLANQLRKAGYATVASGKWHLKKLEEDSDHPHRLGFDEYCFFGWHEGPRYWKPRIWQNGRLRNGVEDRFGPDVYFEFIENFILRERDEPFFAFYSMTLAHAVSNDLHQPPPHGPKGRYLSFAEMLELADQYIGRLVDTLIHSNLAENTLVLICSDNGTSAKNYIRHEGAKLIRESEVVSRINGEVIKGQKGKFNDWGVRVPAIAYWPGRVPAGVTSHALIDVTDLLPTFLELAEGAPISFPIDGRSFVAALTDPSARGREWVSFQNKNMVGLRNRDWKLLSDGSFYDMRNDPVLERPVSLENVEADALEAYDSLNSILQDLAHPTGK